MTVRHEIIDGRDAIVMYLTTDFGPAEIEEAAIRKIMFEDGEVRYMRRPGAKLSRQQRRRMAKAQNRPPTH